MHCPLTVNFYRLLLVSIMIELSGESEIIEKLNSAPSVRGFFIATVEILTDAIDGLIQRVFRKDEFAAQTVVKSLLNESGPLGELSDRLKLLFGIGVLPESVYHDIEDIVALRNNLNQDALEYEFTDAHIIDSLKALSAVKSSNTIPFELLRAELPEDEQLQQIHLHRQTQIIKSGLSLAVVDICMQLNSYPTQKSA